MAWRELDPPGRFLARIDPSRADSLWEDVGDEMACKRAGRTLGEKSVSKTSLKLKHDDQEKKPTAVFSADQAFSSSCSRPKRPSMNFMDEQPSSPCSPPPSKKRRGMSIARDFIRAASNELVEQRAHLNTSPEMITPLSDKRMVTRDLIMRATANLRKPSKAYVTPDAAEKVMDISKSEDFGNNWVGQQGGKANELQESIPTAEFLTQAVFADW